MHYIVVMSYHYYLLSCIYTRYPLHHIIDAGDGVCLFIPVFDYIVHGDAQQFHLSEHLWQCILPALV